MHHPTDRITHTTAFVTPIVEHWLVREIAQNNNSNNNDKKKENIDDANNDDCDDDNNDNKIKLKNIY